MNNETKVDDVYTVELAVDGQSWLIYKEGMLVDRAVTVVGSDIFTAARLAEAETEEDYNQAMDRAEARVRRFNSRFARFLRTHLRRWGII
jgi:hypothetical protein